MGQIHTEQRQAGQIFKFSAEYSQRGVALLTVLFVLVLLTTMAVYVAEDEHLAIRKLENQRDATQGRLVALAGEMWVAKALEQDGNRSSSTGCNDGTTCLLDTWATIDGSTIDLEDGKMTVTAYDEMGKFNLNNLIDGMNITSTSTALNPAFGENALHTPEGNLISPWYSLFVRLLLSLSIEPEKADLIVDWIDADNIKTSEHGAEDQDYLSGRNGPYLAANKPMTSVAELNFITGLSPQDVQDLLPYVSALPVKPGQIPEGQEYPDLGTLTKININTVGPKLLSLLQDPPLEQLELDAIKSYQDNGGYRSIDFALQDFNPTRRSQVAPLISVHSDYFSAHSCAKYGRITYALNSILARNQNAHIAVRSRQRTFSCQP